MNVQELQVGQKVVVVMSSERASMYVRHATVMKITKTTLTIDGGSYTAGQTVWNVAKDGSVTGMRGSSRSSWEPRPQIVHADDPIVAETSEKIRKRHLVRDVQRAISTWERDITADTTKAAILALTDLYGDLKGLG